MENEALSPELLGKIDAYWRAANYLSVGQIYLYDNPLTGGEGFSPCGLASGIGLRTLPRQWMLVSRARRAGRNHHYDARC